MTIWTRIGELLAYVPGRVSAGTEAVGETLDALCRAVRDHFSPEVRRQVAFTMALVALTAKMAKADGVVTADEIAVIKRLFLVEPEDMGNVARLFNLAKQDVAGYDSYAGKIRGLHAGSPELLADVVDGLFAIASADGVLHEREQQFLEHVAEIFGIDAGQFASIEARHVMAGESDPWLVLGLPRNTAPEDVKRHYRRLVTEHHPDKLVSRGFPAEAIRLANDRLAKINAAYALVQRQFAV